MVTLSDKKLRDREYYAKNKETIKARRLEYYYANLEKERLYQKEWAARNRDHLNQYHVNRQVNNIEARIAGNLGKRMNKAIKMHFKVGSSVDDLGCSIQEFKDYIENQFTDGMTWENYGEWHLDHIKPLSSFDLTDRDQFLKACHYTNYQPLWQFDNLSKGAKYEVPE